MEILIIYQRCENIDKLWWGNYIILSLMEKILVCRRKKNANLGNVKLNELNPIEYVWWKLCGFYRWIWSEVAKLKLIWNKSKWSDVPTVSNHWILFCILGDNSRLSNLCIILPFLRLPLQFTDLQFGNLIEICTREPRTPWGP